MKTFLMAAAALAPLLIATAPAAAQSVDGARSWTGAYVGGRAGYSFQPKDGDEVADFDTNLDGQFGDTVRTTTGANAFSPGFCGGAFNSALASGGCSGDQDALTYYGMVGFDFQVPNFANGGIVAGVIAEYGNANVNDSVTAFSTTPAAYSFSRSLRGAGNVRGRLGYAYKNTLAYGTGGLAYGRVRSRYGITQNANVVTDQKGQDARQQTFKDDRWGYTVGGGVEQRITDHFSIGVLYLFTALDDDNYRVRLSGGPATSPFRLVNSTGTDMRRSHSDFARHDVTVTAAYRF